MGNTISPTYSAVTAGDSTSGAYFIYNQDWADNRKKSLGAII